MSEADLEKRVGGVNSIAWMAGHLAWQEQAYWLTSRGMEPIADLAPYKNGCEPCAPSFAELFAAWEQVTAATDAWLDGLTEDDLRGHFPGRRFFEIENIGSLMMRVFGHYYVHVGQITAIRKILGYDVPGFVGSQEGAYFE